MSASSLIRSGVALLALLTMTQAVLAVAGEEPSGLPPLLDRELFFGDPAISGAQLSPDGRWISFLKPYQEVVNIWVKGVDEPFDAARPMTADTVRPITAYFWSESSRYLLYVQDTGGNENFHIWAVDPKAPADPATGVPKARDLTPLDDVRAMIYAVPEGPKDVMVVGLNDRDPAVHDVYLLDVVSGERKLLVTNEGGVAAWVTDLAGNVRLGWRQTPDGGFELLPVKEGSLGDPLYSCTAEETCMPARFHKDGRRVYLVSNRGDDVDLTRLLLLDLATGAAELVEQDPNGEVDFGSAVFADDTEELVATAYIGDRVRVYPRNDAFAHDLEVIRAAVGDGELGLLSTTEDMSAMLVAVSSDVNPGSVYLYRRPAGAVSKLYDSRPELPSQHLARMEPVRYRARDGRSIPGYLTVPRGLQPKALPTVLLVHGGPWARDTWGYDAIAQFLANRGYAVMQPNFRGSTGYGKDFLNAGNGEWGTGAMQHDLTDAVADLVKRGVADGERVAIMGGSYGGYATLAGLAFTPDLYAAGVDIVGPSNIITLLESIPPYWGPIRKMFHTRVGDPDDEADRKRLEAQSPLHSATRVKRPLLVIQGANDPRVKQAESDQIVAALRDLERPVEYLVAADEGHGFRGRDNRLAMFAAVEAFLARHLGGRAQEGASPAVAERLERLRVDVSTVTASAAREGAAAAAVAPLPRPVEGAVVPAKLAYRVTLTMGERSFEMTSEVTTERTSRDGQELLRVATAMEGPMGAVSDTWLLAADTFVPVERESAQGPMKVALAYGPESVTGAITLPGQEIPVSRALEAEVLGEEAAVQLLLAALPLEPGFATTLRTFELQSQKVRLWSAAVAAVEAVEVPAGAFEAFRLALEPLDGEGGGQILWIAQETPRAVVRSEGKLPPQAGGGDVTVVLTALAALGDEDLHR